MVDVMPYRLFYVLILNKLENSARKSVCTMGISGIVEIEGHLNKPHQRIVIRTFTADLFRLVEEKPTRGSGSTVVHPRQARA